MMVIVFQMVSLIALILRIQILEIWTPGRRTAKKRKKRQIRCLTFAPSSELAEHVILNEINKFGPTAYPVDQPPCLDAFTGFLKFICS